MPIFLFFLFGCFTVQTSKQVVFVYFFPHASVCDKPRKGIDMLYVEEILIKTPTSGLVLNENEDNLRAITNITIK